MSVSTGKLDGTICPKCGADHSRIAYCGSRKTGEEMMRNLRALAATPKPEGDASTKP